MPPRRRKPAIGPTLQEPSLQEQALQEQALPLDGATIGSVGAAPVGNHGHRQRLRSRFLTAGAAGFADYELLELLLFHVVPPHNTKPLATSIAGRTGRKGGVHTCKSRR